MRASWIYLDSSVALRTVLDVPERDRLRAWLDDSDATFVSSRLLRTETIRVLRREGREPSEATPLFDRIGLVDVTPQVHRIAETIERHVTTLDALHLATALVIGEPVVATHDRTMASVARHLGLGVTDPVDDEG